MERVPTKAECWAKFWNIIAQAHVEACDREAAEAARLADEQRGEPTRSEAD